MVGGQFRPLAFVHQCPQLHQPLGHQCRPPPRHPVAVVPIVPIVLIVLIVLIVPIIPVVPIIPIIPSVPIVVPVVPVVVAVVPIVAALQESHEFGNVQVDEVQFFRHAYQVEALFGDFLLRFNQHFDQAQHAHVARFLHRCTVAVRGDGGLEAVSEQRGWKGGANSSG